MRWRFGRTETEVKEATKWKRHIDDDDAEKIPVSEQKPTAKNRYFPLKKIQRKVAFILLVFLEPTVSASDRAGFLCDPLCSAWAWQSECHRSAGHRHLCQTSRGLQASFLLGGLSLRLGGIGPLSLACEAVRRQVSFSQHPVLFHLHSSFYFSTINSHNNFHKGYYLGVKKLTQIPAKMN